MEEKQYPDNYKYNDYFNIKTQSSYVWFIAWKFFGMDNYGKLVLSTDYSFLNRYKKKFTLILAKSKS